MGEEPKINVENRDIERVYKTTFLVVVIDSKMKRRYHVDYIGNRISKNIGIIVKVKNILNLKTTKDLYYFFHISVFELLLLCVGYSPFRELAAGETSTNQIAASWMLQATWLATVASRHIARQTLLISLQSLQFRSQMEEWYWL